MKPLATPPPTNNRDPHSLPANVSSYLALWLPVATAAGVMAGTASAFLLTALNRATDYREAHRLIILLLPLAGLAIGCLYKYLGASVEAGNNLLLEEIHDPQAVIPLRMTPLVLLGTIATHLFGGSAGREGTALQTGASLADQLSKPLHFAPHQRRILLMAGIAGGFASVFGTPMAGAVFGIEVLAIGAYAWEGLLPCLIAAFIGDLTTRAWHVHHTLYPVSSIPRIAPSTLAFAAVAGVAFGLIAMAFARSTHAISSLAKKWIPWSPARPFLGGTIIAAAVFASGTTRYIGLGIPTIVAAFTGPLPHYAFALKFLLTTITLGFGFKGGEVTPLFFIGATLGNALSGVLPLPASLLAGLGFVGVFAGAANTPIASTLMAFELFGPRVGLFAAIACAASYFCSGHAGIYGSQRIARHKFRRNN